MEVMQDLLTDPKPLETYSLLGLLTNVRKQYQAEPHGRACARLIQKVYEVDPKFWQRPKLHWYVQNAAMKCK